jgi:hypothetical protein
MIQYDSITDYTWSIHDLQSKNVEKLFNFQRKKQ